MNKNDLYEIQRMLHSKGMLISFSGRLSQELIEEYGQAVRKYLETEERPKTEVFNIFSIFIETTQNIKNYSQLQPDTPNGERIGQSAIVAIGKLPSGGNYISSGNLIDNRDADALRERIDRINELDKDGLKQLYKERLRAELPEGSTSAGIGLIDIARKSKSPLEYSINPVDDQLSFFTLIAVI